MSFQLSPVQRSIAVFAATLLVLSAALWGISRNEKILADGTSLLLELAPVDPRSIMQGDYMALSFALDRQLPDDALQHKYAWLSIDQHNVASLHSVSNALPDTTNMIAVKIRQRDRMLSLGPNAFFFTEGTAETYEQARYGEFRVDDSGNALLTALRDENYQLLENNQR